MQKGQIVKCVVAKQDIFTVGQEYEVVAGRGDTDFRIGGRVENNGMILIDDNGEGTYCVFPECLFGKWELVK